MEMVLYNYNLAHLESIKLGKVAEFYLRMKSLNPHEVKKEEPMYKKLADLLEYKKMLMVFPLIKYRHNLTHSESG